MSRAANIEAIRLKGSQLGREQSVILALIAAVQIGSIAMVYLDSTGKLATYYRINETFDQMRRVIRGKKALDVEQLNASRKVAEKQLNGLGASDDEAADVAADALDVMIQVMKQLEDPSGSSAVDAVLAACDVASRLAEAVTESSEGDDASPFVEGDAAVDKGLDIALQAVRQLDEVSPDQLAERATKILDLAGPVGVDNGDLMRSLIQGH